ncbi:MAG: ribonuclease domain-containing protein [Bacillota bacterium]
MRRFTKTALISLTMVILLLVLTACSGLEEAVEPVEQETPKEAVEENVEETIAEDGYYTSPEDVALFIHTYGRLPDNYITKEEAMDLDWDAQEGNLWEATDRMSIGGNRFGNREKLLPEADGRQYYEADVNYEGGYRGAERIVYSNDGLVFYTKDHYESFEQLY